MTAEDMEYIEEDLRSPCTQEIAVFKAFADIVEKADTEIVVIDTAPTGHTCLLYTSAERVRVVSKSIRATAASGKRILMSSSIFSVPKPRFTSSVPVSYTHLSQ